MPSSSDNNEAIWDELVANDVLCSRPKFDLTPDSARTYLNREKWYGADLNGKKVLCLACGGGQQSIAFALLGAELTVVDFSAPQLEKDKLIAERLNQPLRIIKADMRDLSMLADAEFDIVYQPYSINYVPNVDPVFDEVARILKPDGFYDLMLHNPYVHGSWKDGSWGSEWKAEELWREKGYPIWQPYRDGEPIQTDDPHWNFATQAGEEVRIQSPQEYRHTLSSILNGMIRRGLTILSFEEEIGEEYDAPVGSWEHYCSVAPPWLYVIGRKV
ncbi:MAG: methyltransferase domain-containing protein [Bacteroidota bacterium]